MSRELSLPKIAGRDSEGQAERSCRGDFQNQEELTRSAFVYIEGFYNPKRPHAANSNLSPKKKEDMLKKTHHNHIMIPSLSLSVFLTKVRFSTPSQTAFPSRSSPLILSRSASVSPPDSSRSPPLLAPHAPDSRSPVFWGDLPARSLGRALSSCLDLVDSDIITQIWIVIIRTNT